MTKQIVTREMVEKAVKRKKGKRVFLTDAQKAKAVKYLLAHPGSGYQLGFELGVRPASIYRWAQDPRFNGVEGGVSGRATESPEPEAKPAPKRKAAKRKNSKSKAKRAR